MRGLVVAGDLVDGPVDGCDPSVWTRKTARISGSAWSNPSVGCTLIFAMAEIIAVALSASGHFFASVQSVPMPSMVSSRVMTKPERRYTIALIVLAFLYVITIGEFLLLLRRPLPGSDPATARFVDEFVIFSVSAHLVVISLILLIRWRWPAGGGLVLTALNIILLLAFPLGTILGVYYLWKVNKVTT